jgi:hypothetical protein
VGLLATSVEIEEIVDENADRRNARRAADEDDLVDLRGGELRVLERLLAGRGGARDNGGDELLELRPRDLAGVALGWLSSDGGQGDVEARGVGAGERDLGLDDSLADLLDGFAAVAGVLSDCEFLVPGDVVEGDGDQQVVDVVAAEVGVAVGGDDLEDALMQLENGDIEGAAAEVVDGDEAVLLLVEAVGERGGFLSCSRM